MAANSPTPWFDLTEGERLQLVQAGLASELEQGAPVTYLVEKYRALAEYDRLALRLLMAWVP